MHKGSHSGVKYDQDKIRLSLVPSEAIQALLEVMEYGAKKYTEDGWRTVSPVIRYYDAIFRHLEAWRRGEIIDNDSGLTHLAHVMANAVILYCREHNSEVKNECK